MTRVSAAPSATRPSRWREAALVFGTWLAGALVYFRRPVVSGFDTLSGDSGDARLVGVLHEHWIEVLFGRAAWRTPPFFHPISGTLGYSDTFILNQVLYAPLRAIGLDRYSALQWTMILLTLLGFVGCYLVGTRLLRAPRGVVLLLSLLAVFANSLYVQMGHIQMLAVHWLPWLALLVDRVWRSASVRRQAGWAAGAGLLFGLLVWSTYYVAWFAAFAAALGAIALAVRCRRELRAIGLPTVLDRCWRPIVAAVAGAVVPLNGFLITYLPTLRDNGGRTFDEAFFYSPAATDLVNVGRGNVLWGGTVEALLGTGRAFNYELASSVTPLVMVALLACAVALFRRRREMTTPADKVVQVLVAVAFVLPLLCVHIGSFILWRVVWLVPGASGLRAIGRIQLLAAFLAPIAMMGTIAALRRAQPVAVASRRWTIGVLAVIGLLLVEQLNTWPLARVDRSTELAFIRITPAPPSECESFFLLSAPGRTYYELHIDAMIIAQTHHLPTINGYSGGEPQNWVLYYQQPDYLDRVEAWVSRHRLDNVCSYDGTTRVWTVDAVEAR